MNEPTIRDGFTELGIFEKGMTAWTSSLELARVFDRPHDQVLKEVRKTFETVDSKFGLVNFNETYYKDSQNRKQPCYNLTRKGFTLIAMGFTGIRALRFKVAYIEAFEKMIQLIETRILSKEGYKMMCGAIAKKFGTDRLIFATEANMVNKAVLGMTSKDFRLVNGLKTGETPRDAVVIEKLEQLDAAQRLNANLILADVQEVERKRILSANYKKDIY